MEETTNFFLTNEEKNAFIAALTPELALLRAKAGISQEEIANLLGISRQTYGAIERKVRKMSWSTYLSLVMFYDYNQKTHASIRNLAAFPHALITRFNRGEAALDFDLTKIFKADTSDIVAALDAQALSTLKTVLMIEYSRCKNVSGDAVIKLFEGMDFSKRENTSLQRNTVAALKNIKRKKLNHE